MNSPVSITNILKVLTDHQPSGIDGIDMFGNIECPCGWRAWEDIHAPKAEHEHQEHVALMLQEAFQDGRLFSPEFHEVFQAIVEACDVSPPA